MEDHVLDKQMFRHVKVDHLLDLPAKQCTKTPPPFSLASSMKEKHSSKYCSKFVSRVSSTDIHEKEK